MNTTSTKSRAKKETGSKAQSTQQATRCEISERAWQMSALAILLLGAFLRLFKLSLVPLHHDEGVNGNFLVSLVRNGTYTYDPNNYHGPTLYYFSAIIPWLARFFGGRGFGEAYGLTTFNVRFVTAAFGVATIGLALLLRKRLGTIGALSAAGLIAISPGAVYLSRYFIHESLFVFFTLGVIVAAVKYYDTGAGVYLILAAMSAALMVATKETWIINGPVLLVALITTIVYFWFRKLLGISKESKGNAGGANDGLHRFGGAISIATVALVAFTVFVVVNVFFYSSFFTNYPKGVYDSLQTLALWRKRTQEHVHPWKQYIKWLLLEEGLVLMLGGVGALIALWRANNRFALFIAQFAFGLLAAYSLVGYKTPWISLNFIVPLALIAGYGLNVAYEKLCDFRQPGLFALPAVLIVAFCGYQLYQLNFVHYDDDQYVYVYAHTRRETLVMLEQIDRVANKMGTGYDTGIALVSPEYWPLPWYFRNYPRVGYYQKVVPTTEPIIVGSVGQEEEIEATYGDRYRQIDSNTLSDPRIDPQRNRTGGFSLRPGVDLLLYVRSDVPK